MLETNVVDVARHAREALEIAEERPDGLGIADIKHPLMLPSISQSNMFYICGAAGWAGTLQIKHLLMLHLSKV